MTDIALENAIKAARILIVDDLEANVEMVAGLLDLGGYTDITGVTNSKEGLALAESGNYDLVLLDMRMPEIDGREFMHRIRAGDLKEKPSILVLTAQTDEETRRAALQGGARDFIAKPLKAWELLLRVHNALEIQILYREARAFNDTLEARVTERTYELAEANRAKSEFLANISHELRTPLNAILGFSDVIQKKVLGPDAIDNYADYAADIHTSGQHLLALIEDILDLSKIEAGHGKLDEANVSIKDVTHTTARILLGDQFAQAGLTLAIESGAPDMEVRVDARRLKQALANLLSNAVKFTPKGGQVTLTVVHAPHGGLGLSVRDTGIGIAPEDIAVALSPFGQIESAFTRKHAGTGLGLPLARALIELHGGSLELESEVDVGTSATLWLPAERVLRQ